MVLHIVRAVYLLVVLAFTTSFAFQSSVYRQGPTFVTLFILIPAAAAFALIMVDMFWRRKRLQALSGLFFGLLAGLFIAYVLSQIVTLGGNVFAPQSVSSGSNGNGAKAGSALSEQAYDHGYDHGYEKGYQSGYYAASTPASQPVAAVPPSSTQPARKSPRPSMAEDGSIPEIQENAVASLLKVLLGASAVFMCVSFILQTKDDFRFVIPYVEFSKQTKGARPLLLDTSVIIDGRIADIAETRILESEMIVPRFILAELQAIADSDDKLKRNRGRRGLDVLNRLRSNAKISIRIMDARVPSVEAAGDVDAKLVALGEHLNGRVITNDYNLNKVAQLRGVDVININDLANALKPIVLPGEAMQVKIIKPGEEAGQGVGYLEDGTMVVAEQGRDHVGREITITVTSVLQTSAGRMIFGRLDADKTFSPRRN